MTPVLTAKRRGRVNPGLETWSCYFATKAEGPLHSSIAAVEEKEQVEFE